MRAVRYRKDICFLFLSQRPIAPITIHIICSSLTKKRTLFVGFREAPFTPFYYCPVKLFGCIRISSNHARCSLSSIFVAYLLCPIATI